MTKKCFYCGDVLTEGHFMLDHATMIMPGTYAHTDCIDSHGKENTMTDQTQHILGAADSAHQGIDLARSLVQESLGNMGEILTQGCEKLGAASLDSTMRLGQKLKELSFVLDDLLKDAHGLCILLGRDLGVCEGVDWEMADSQEQGLSYGDRFSPMDMLDSEDLGPGEDEAGALPEYLDGIDWGDPEPGEDEFDDDEQPF